MTLFCTLRWATQAQSAVDNAKYFYRITLTEPIRLCKCASVREWIAENRRPRAAMSIRHEFGLDVKPWRKRHKKDRKDARCCWVCGKRGGQGFTVALRLAGYPVADGEIGYAHSNCMHKVRMGKNEGLHRT